MKALPTCEPPALKITKPATDAESESASRTEAWMMAMLILLVPTLGGALYQCRATGLQRVQLARELAESRALSREVVDDLIETQANLAARESQVERLIEATMLADDEMRQLRGAVVDWRRQHEALAQRANREIATWSAYSMDVERRLGEAQRTREADRQRVEDEITSMRNQLAATGCELRETQDFAREAVLWNQQLEQGARSLQSRNRSLSQSLSNTQSALSSAESDASSARSEADSAEAARDRARRALGRAEGTIQALKKEVVLERREDAREHNMGVVRPPSAEAPRPHSEPAKASPPATPAHRDQTGGKGRR